MNLYKLVTGIFVLLAFASAKGAETAETDTVTASDVFVNTPTRTLDILTRSQRMDLLDYYKADSIYNVMNVMEGFSHLVPPVTDRFIQVQLTPVTLFTVKILSAKKKGPLAMTVYTVGDSLLANDSEIRFYDTALNELDRDKYIKLASTKDFFDFKGTDGKTRKEIIDLIPFPTVKYTVTPDSNRMTAELTVGEFLTKETLEKITPYLRRTREYEWNGSKWELLPMRSE